MNAAMLAAWRQSLSVQMRGGLKPMRAHKSSNSACRLRAMGAVKRTMMKLVARGAGQVQENL
jgi:hypothetical protein